ncbi:MAG TPA: RnfABCDGE type electron transport complex subunit B [Clostridia bacterium]|nr:RnfABCDGE type electron transport complex subunit B [Clostridia bacterium]
MGDIIAAVLVISGLGLIFGIGLSYASKVFAVKVDERTVRIREVLPGANCGGCGFAGCDSYADAVVTNGAETNCCPVGGSEVAGKVAAIMGVEAEGVKRAAARVLCNGRCSVSREKYEYHGIDSCTAAAQLYGGHKACAYGCLGHGDCVKACPFEAIDITGGIARVIEDRCKACGKCLAACPKKLIEIIPKDKKYSVMCRSRDKGPVTKSNCEVGCIGCTKCVKACGYSAISMEGALARIDYDLCTNCGECTKVCPTMAIRVMDFGE